MVSGVFFLKKFCRKYIFMFPLFVALILFVIYGLLIVKHNNDVVTIENDVLLATENYNQVLAGSLSSFSSVVYDVSGFDSVRARRDDKVFSEFLDQILNWKDESEYRNARNKLIEMLGVEGSSQLLEYMFVDLPDVNDEAGNSFSIYGTKVNMTCDGFISYPVLVIGDVYTYLSVVSVSSVKDGVYIGRGYCFFRYSVDNDSNLLNVSGYTTYSP